MRAVVSRHGGSNYSQREVSLAEANDLTIEGIEKVIQSASEFATQFLGKNDSQHVTIDSSPFGRCLYTAKIWQEVLREREIYVDPDVHVNSDLTEIHNLDYPTFILFVKGGRLNFQEQHIAIDPVITNPDGLGPTRYFRDDKIHRLSRKAKSKLPKELLEKVESFETYNYATKRFDRALKGLNPSYEHHVLVTHEGFTGKCVERIAGNDRGTPYLDRGKFFVLESHDNNWVPVYVQEEAIVYEK